MEKINQKGILTIRTERECSGKIKGYSLLYDGNLIGRTLVGVGLEKDVSIRILNLDNQEWSGYDINGESMKNKSDVAREQIEIIKDAHAETLPEVTKLIYVDSREETK